jgi:cardiolipin synthase
MTGGGPRHFERLRQTLFGRRYWSKFRFTAGNDVQLFRSGEAFFTSLIERVDAAQTDVVL